MSLPKFYWFQLDYFILAVDAVSIQDARQYLSAWFGIGAKQFNFLGHFHWSKSNSTACCGITGKRQEEISANLRQMQ